MPKKLTISGKEFWEEKERLDKLFNDAIQEIRERKIKPRWYKEVFDKTVCSSEDFIKFFNRT